MWRKACLLLASVLAVGLVFTRRRLSEAEAELEGMRSETGADGKSVREPAPVETTGDLAATTSGGKTPEAMTATSDLSTEWEQAVPPMDS